jgi:hypothetical protein
MGNSKAGLCRHRMNRIAVTLNFYVRLCVIQAGNMLMYEKVIMKNKKSRVTCKGPG